MDTKIIDATIQSADPSLPPASFTPAQSEKFLHTARNFQTALEHKPDATDKYMAWQSALATANKLEKDLAALSADEENLSKRRTQLHQEIAELSKGYDYNGAVLSQNEIMRTVCDASDALHAALQEESFSEEELIALGSTIRTGWIALKKLEDAEGERRQLLIQKEVEAQKIRNLLAALQGSRVSKTIAAREARFQAIAAEHAFQMFKLRKSELLLATTDGLVPTRTLSLQLGLNIE